MELTDLQIKEKIIKKDTTVYEYIIERFSKQLYYLAYNIMHISCSTEDLEECVSDVFFYAWQNIFKFDETRGSFKTWLFILTKYKALEYKRRKSKVNITDISSIEIADSENIENKIIAKEKQKEIMNIVETFTPTDKELFIRRYYFNEKITTLMESTSLTRSAIDNRLLRCRKRIKEAFSYE